MGQATSACTSRVKSAIDATQEKTMNVLCFCRKRSGKAAGGSGAYRYGSLAMNKYDESDDEDTRGILYNNNLLLDDDDDEEEQIVIITKDKTAKKPEQRSAQPTTQTPVDHSVF